jgi:hypothetical protein
VRIGKALSSIDTASDLWACDFALHGMRQWGKDEGLALAESATGLSQHFLRRCARIAERFTPEKRYAGLNRNHYRKLLPFDAAQIDAWLPTVNFERLSAGALRALAVEKFGKPKKSHELRDKGHGLYIRESLWAALAPIATSRKVVPLIEMILEEWLKNPPAAQAIVRAVDESQRRRKSENRPPSTEESREKDAARMRERRAEAKNDAVGDTETSDPQADDVVARPTYAERRAAQSAAKEKVRAEKRVERVKNQSIRGIEISLHGSCAIGKTSKWLTLEEASTAAARYEAAKNYPIEGFKCDKCNFFHICCDEARMAEAFARAKQRAREIQAHVGSVESDDPASSYAETRPNYAQRRAEQKESASPEALSEGGAHAKRGVSVPP